jgi:DNA polymerase III delta prime subunit
MLRKNNQGTSALARVACTLALRESLSGTKNLHDNENFSVVVRVPVELSKDYIAAAADLITLLPGVEEFEVSTPVQSSKGKTDFSEVYTSLRLHERILIITDQSTPLPRAIVAAADAVLDAKPIDATTIAQAVLLVHDRDYPISTVSRMLSYPITEVFGAIRAGRGAESALARLEEAHRQSSPTEDPPRVEELHGYGAAVGWARELATDLEAWRKGSIAWSELDAGLLLSGPPGVGKSMFAKAVAKSCGVAFVASSLAQWQSRGHLGDLLGAMRATFAEATAKSPCILLLDEFDSIGDRTQFRREDAQYCTEVIAGLLECLDGVQRREGIVVLGACNHPQMIDAALLRPGRLGTHIHIGLPDAAARKGILREHLPVGPTDEQLAEAVRECEGFSGADLANLAKTARRLGRRRGEEPTVEDLLASLPPLTPIKGALRERITVHEAGHVAVGLALEIGSLTGVVVRSGSRTNMPIGGSAVFEPANRLANSHFFLDNIALYLGGMAAEIVVFGDHLDGSGGAKGSDLHNAADLATVMATQLGMGATLNHFRAESSLDREVLRRIFPAVNREVEETLAAQLMRAKDIVQENIDFVRELAGVLDRDGVADGEQARALFRKGVTSHGA